MAHDCIRSAKASGVHVFDETYFFLLDWHNGTLIFFLHPADILLLFYYAFFFPCRGNDEKLQ